MLESLATWVINTYLGEYVENLNTHQLSIGILNGNVELENLPLRKDALRGLDLPVEVQAGFIGKLQLQIPIGKFQSKAWVIRIDQLYLVACPPKRSAYDETSEKRKEQEKKQAELKAIEEKWKAGRQEKSGSFWSTLTSSFMGNVSENLQLVIENVHWRYEDTTLSPGRCVAFGVTINRLALQSADENWKPNFVTGASKMRKLVELEKLAVYWDTDARPVGDVPANQLQSAFEDCVSGRKTHEYILEPASAKAKLTRDYSSKPLHSVDVPRFLLELNLDEIPFSLSDRQYEGMLQLGEVVHMQSRARAYRKWHPGVRFTKENVVKYWKFAIECVANPLKERNERETWTFILKRSRDNVKYVSAYMQKLAKTSISSEDLDLLATLETDLSLDEVVELRRIAYARIKKEDALAKSSGVEKQGFLQSWFPAWTGWKSQEQEEQAIPEDLFASFETSSADESIFKRDTVFLRLLCSLKGGSLTLKSNRSNGVKAFTELAFTDLGLSVDTKLRYGSMAVSLSLGSIQQQDLLTEGTLFPKLIAPQQKSKNFLQRHSSRHFQRLWTVEEAKGDDGTHSQDAFFTLSYEKNPSESDADYRISISALPLDLVYNRTIVDEIKRFLQPSESSAERRLRKIARQRYEQLKTDTKAELKQTFDQWTHAEAKRSKLWEINLNIAAPHIIFPEDFTDSKQKMVVLDLGHFSVWNLPPRSVDLSKALLSAPERILPAEEEESDDEFKTPPSTPPCERETDDSPDGSSVDLLDGVASQLRKPKRLYESDLRYKIEAADLQILVGCKGEDWKGAHTSGRGDLHVVEKFTISLELERYLMHKRDSKIPNASVYGNLPNLAIQVDEGKLQALASCLKNLNKSSVEDEQDERKMPSDSRYDDDDLSPRPGSLNVSQWAAEDQDDENDTFYSLHPNAIVESRTSVGISDSTKPVDAFVELRQLVARFSVGEVTLGIKSRNRSISELRFAGLRVSFVQRPYDVRVRAVLQDLVMVDALQTFGRDYDLLIRSRKNIDPDHLDSIRTLVVEAQSPVQETIAWGETEPQVVDDFEEESSDALLTIDFMQVTDDCPDDVVLPGSGKRRTIDLKFKSLHVTANQETVVELKSFFERAFPDEKNDEGPARRGTIEDVAAREAKLGNENLENVKTEVAAEFFCLSILLVRDENRVGSRSLGTPIGRKVASIQLHELFLSASLSRSIDVSGSLTGVQVLNDVPEGRLHKEIFRIGIVPSPDDDGGDDAADVDGTVDVPDRALSFEVTSKPAGDNQTTGSIKVKARLASMHYLHTRPFLNELQLCASDFHHFTDQVAVSLSTAAAGVAKGIVGQKETLKEGMVYLSKSFGGPVEMAEEDVVDGRPSESSSGFPLKVYLDFDMKSPVVYLPTALDSRDMFVAYLGHISASNDFVRSDENGYFVDRLVCQLAKMRLFRCTLDETADEQGSMKTAMGMDTKQSPAILDKTSLKLTIDRPLVERSSGGEIFAMDEGIAPLDDVDDIVISSSNVALPPLSVVGEVTTSPRITLSKPVMKQALITLDFVTGDKSDKEPAAPVNSTPPPLSPRDDSELSPYSPSPPPDDVLKIVAAVSIPCLTFVMRGSVSSTRDERKLNEEDIVEITLENLGLTVNKTKPYVMSLQVKLGSLMIEDLLQDAGTLNRYIMSSRHQKVKGNAGYGPLLFQSSLRKPILNPFRSLPVASSPISSPSRGDNASHALRTGDLSVSPVHKKKAEENLDLVKIDAIFVSKDDPDFQSRYNSIGRTVDVDFNMLQLTVNLQTWVILLDFFGIGVPDNPDFVKKKSTPSHPPSKPKEPVDTNVNLRIASLSLTMNKDAYQLARAAISGVDAIVKMRDGYKELSGQLRSARLVDLSPNGVVYGERFGTTDRPFVFAITKYAEPDWDLKRSFDIRVELEAPKVRYVHTQRFLKETIAFCEHFVQSMDAYQRMKADADDNLNYQGPTRSPRIALDIEADRPEIVFPRSSSSTDVIVLELGHLKATNRFLFADDESTLNSKATKRGGSTSTPEPTTYGYAMTEEVPLTSTDAAEEHRSWMKGRFRGPCLLDCIDLSLSDVNVFTAQKMSESLGRPVAFEKRGGRVLADKCQLNLKIERNLCKDLSKNAPEFLIDGQLSTMHFLVDKWQYNLIKDMLDHNIGEPVSEFKRPEGKVKDPILQPSFDGSWVVVDLTMTLVNVSVELVVTHELSLLGSESARVSLAQFNLERSQFHVKTHSNQSKTVNLSSMALTANDVRQVGSVETASTANVFTEILSPNDPTGSSSTPQLEISFSMSEKRDKATIVLHRARLYVIVDWLLAVKDFLLEKPSESTRDDVDVDEVDCQAATKEDRPVVTVVEKPKKPLDISMSVTRTDFVVVQNANERDCNAIILKWTLVMTSNVLETTKRGLSMTLSDIELFSCCLGNEDDTALSIIDPAELAISLEPGKQAKQGSDESLPDLEIFFQRDVNIRLSYRDLELFLAIASSVKSQLEGRGIFSNDIVSEDEEENDDVDDLKLKRLKQLGYSPRLCREALIRTKGDFNASADWLVDNAYDEQVKVVDVVDDEKSESEKRFKIEAAGIEIRCGSLLFTLIDDCDETDTPLIEVAMKKAHFYYRLLNRGSGKLSVTMLGDYYNKNLGAWEPFLEPWSCFTNWSVIPDGSTQRKIVKVEAPERLELNLTSSLLDLIKTTRHRWGEEYDRFTRQSDETKQRRRKRIPFKPFLLRNNTGCQLHFATSIVNPSRVDSRLDSSTFSSSSSSKESLGSVTTSQWRAVVPGEECYFAYETHSKRRYQRSSVLHQLEVKVDGWRQISPPVWVDKVGIFFRHVKPLQESESAVDAESFTDRDNQPVYVVFAISVIKSVKVINVRSALVVRNKLEIPLELIALRPDSESEGVNLPSVEPASHASIPLHLATREIRVRPFGIGYAFSDSTLSVITPDQRHKTLQCPEIGNEKNLFRLCCTTSRDGLARSVAATGHTIDFLPPLVVHNLLPVDMQLQVSTKDLPVEVQSVRAGKHTSLYSVNPDCDVRLSVSVDPFVQSEEVTVPLVNDVFVKLSLWDGNSRELWLFVKTHVSGKALIVYIVCQFWLVNKTGLPLVFRQDDSTTESAGQGTEHEMARSMVPLLFSLSNSDLSKKCSLRLGASPSLKDGHPLWSRGFSLTTSEGGFVQAHVSQGYGRPDAVYEIGYMARNGSGVYRDIIIVTFVTRFLLLNRSCHNLAYAQKHEIDQMSSSPAVAMPNSVTSYSWSRVDLDQLLCIRIEEIPHCRWSSGFRITQDGSFHVIMRGASDVSYFVRVEVTLKDATYHVVISGTGQTPPPFKIENLSKSIPVTFYQKQTTDVSLRREIKPSQTVPYAWDDTILPGKLCLSVADGKERTYDIDTYGEKEPLTYRNYVYIAVKSTMHSSSKFGGHSLGATQRHLTQSSTDELVLDVPQGKAVLFRRRKANRASQLWRMTAAGNLEHMGSARMTDSSSSRSQTTMVLDVTDEKAGKSNIPLIIRRLDEKRVSTQTWKFDADGRLHPSHLLSAYVQPSGYLTDGCDAVLGPGSSIGGEKPPPEQVLCLIKQKDGTGALSVQVVAEGPIRVVKIQDKMPHRTSVSLPKRLSSRSLDSQIESSTDAEPIFPQSSFQFIVNLESGLGLSVINSIPEEIAYVTLTGFETNYLYLKGEQSLEVVVQHVQIDNQLVTNRPLSPLLYRTPSSKPSKEKSTFSLRVVKGRATQPGVEIFKELHVFLKPMSLQIDERLLLKFAQFIGLGKDDNQAKEEQQLHSSVAESAPGIASSMPATHYYCRDIVIKSLKLTLSVLTVKHLPDDLAAVKKYLATTLINFENATMKLESLKRTHSFESLGAYVDIIRKFYAKQFSSQAARILGSVDMLGNPFGLLHDVASGVDNLTRGNVIGFAKNVTHGVLDSASKITSTVSSAFDVASMDDEYSAERAQIKDTARTSGEHLVAGIQGLGHGIFGGLTSVITQTTEGAVKKGVSGFFSGLVKGVVGTVAKPVGGVLDLAASTAAAVSVGTTSSKAEKPASIRRPRYCIGLGGVLPPYSSAMAQGWEFLLQLNEGDSSEQLVAYEGLSFGMEKMCIIVSSEELFVFGKRTDNLIVRAKVSNVNRCEAEEATEGTKTKAYIQLTVLDEVKGWRRKQIRCESLKIAKKVTQHINYARTLHRHSQLTVRISPEQFKEIW